MEHRALEREDARTEPHVRSSALGGTYPLVLGAFLGVYGLISVMLNLGLGGGATVFVGSLILLVLLGAGVFVGSLLEVGAAGQWFYLTLSILPGLTIARLAFAALPQPILDPLFAYLLLAGTILVLGPHPEAIVGARRLRREHLLRALPIGGALAAGLVALGLVLPLEGGPIPQGPVWFPILVLAPAAFLDELWFRGILQGAVARVTSAPGGWLATVVLFAAYGSPFSTLSAILVRLGVGVVLGALAIRRENVPAVLIARPLVVAALVALSPGLAGTSVLV